jgi:hypothetical protein
MIPKSTLFKARILGPLALGVAAGYALSDPKVKESVEYGKYLGKHKLNIIKPMRQMNLGWGQALKHDLSKLGPKEFGPYREYFAGPTGVTGTNDPKTHELWRAAVRHHHNAPGNLHHYRALGLKGTVAPLKYKMEAVADWHSVQKTKGRTNESFPEWYTRLKDKLPIEEQTRMEIDKRLGLTKKAAYILEKEAWPKIPKGKLKELAALPKEIIEGNLKNPSRLLNIRTGIPEVDSSLEAVGKHIIPYAKNTNTGQAVQKVTKPVGEYIGRVEQHGAQAPGLKTLNKHKYTGAAIAGSVIPYPGATEALAASPFPLNMAAYHLSKSPRYRLLRKNMSRMIRNSGNTLI